MSKIDRETAAIILAEVLIVAAGAIAQYGYGITNAFLISLGAAVVLSGAGVMLFGLRDITPFARNTRKGQR